MNKLILQEIQASDLTPKEMQLVGSAGARFVRFQHAILARAETNKNQDHIDEKGIEELASTLPLTAIDDEHKKDKVIGYFTDARAVTDGEGKLLDTDGILHADRFPQETAAVMNGSKLLSIEADAEKATCSECHQEFIHEDAYCNHLASRLIDRRATRELHGLMAKGGATTYNPAGTDTHFDLKHIELIASAFGDGKSGGSTAPEEELVFASELEYELWSADPAKFNAIVAKKLSYKERKKLPGGKFALIQKKDGKTLKRFPIHDCNHARNALARLTNAKGLSSAERAQVKRKANAKLNSKECATPGRKEKQKANAMRAAQWFAACAMAADPMPLYPGQIQYRPVFSPFMAADTPDWVKEIAAAGQLGAPAHPKHVVDAKPKVDASASDAQDALKKHLTKPAGEKPAGKKETQDPVKAEVRGFWLGPSDESTEDQTLEIDLHRSR